MIDPQNAYWLLVGLFGGFILGTLGAEVIGERISGRVVDRLVEFAEDEDEAA